MPRIIDYDGFGKHCHWCAEWMPRRALRKESTCPSCKRNILSRKWAQCYASRCIECDAIILDSFMVCEICGLDTANGVKRKEKIKKAKELSAIARQKYNTSQISQEDLDCSLFSEDFSEMAEDNKHQDVVTAAGKDEDELNEDLDKERDAVAPAIKRAVLNDDQNKLWDVAGAASGTNLEDLDKERDAVAPAMKRAVLNDDLNKLWDVAGAASGTDCC